LQRLRRRATETWTLQGTYADETFALSPLESVAAGGAARAPAADEEPRFNITVVNTPAKSFFLGLVHDTPYNMVVSADVSGSISLDLKQVTVPEVLQMTRELYGYDFEKLPAGFLVLPATIQSRMFTSITSISSAAAPRARA
jgi:type II secretory pathway component HofQ